MEIYLLPRQQIIFAHILGQMLMFLINVCVSM
jgi:hypothetical protein